MSDHKARAQDWLELADESSDWVVDAPKRAVDRFLAAAQVEATLYLAEQQRIANLIASIDKWGGESNSWPYAIQEGLGLA